MSLESMFCETNEMNRRALVADLGATLAEQPEFRAHVEAVRQTMPLALAWAIDQEGWIVEPAGGDIALESAGSYGLGLRRRRITAIFLRSAAAALTFAPPEFSDPWVWAEISLMNVGAVACTPSGQAAGPRRRPSEAALGCRDRGCRGIALRGAGRCVICGVPVTPVPVNGAIVDRSHRPFACASHSTEDERHVTDAMQRVFDRCEWLLDEAMTLQVDLLPVPVVLG